LLRTAHDGQGGVERKLSIYKPKKGLTPEKIIQLRRFWNLCVKGMAKHAENHIITEMMFEYGESL